MGKGKGKRKRKQKQKQTTDSEKRSKASFPPPPPPPPPSPPLRNVTYDDMPKNHKKKFFINDDVGGGLMKYVELIQWLRVMGCFDGDVFEDIPNMNWAEVGYPLVEIEIITPQNKFAKFIISKPSLYLIGCYVQSLKFQFKCEFVVDSFTMLQSYDGRYTTEPWKLIGPKCMIDAVNLLADAKPNDLGDVPPYVGACEVFYVHLCEAARLYVVESLVCRTLEQHASVYRFENPSYEEEEGFILTSDGGKVVAVKEDAYSLVKANGPINLDHSVVTPHFIEYLIKNYKVMCKVWFTYSLTERKYFEMKPVDVSILHMRSRKSLRSTLAVLCNTNLDKILKEWRKKSTTHPTITPDVYQKMVIQVRELQQQRKVLVHTTGIDSQV